MCIRDSVQRSITKPLAVATRTARINEQHSVAFRNVDLKGRVEGPTEHPVRAAVNTENEGTLAIFGAALGFHGPSLNLGAIKTGKIHFFRHRQTSRTNKAVVVSAQSANWNNICLLY